MILNWILANANLIRVLHHARTSIRLMQLLSTVLLALSVRIRSFHGVGALARHQLLLLLGALTVDLS